MNTDADYYAVLGVLPDAEQVVIVAAYRALASLYHPDRWKGDVAAATKRMAEMYLANDRG
jgi:curved DNA-binding protein CbpA